MPARSCTRRSQRTTTWWSQPAVMGRSGWWPGSCGAPTTALGILPLGSIMNIPRMLDMPRDLEGAAGVLRDGHVRTIDVGAVRRDAVLRGGVDRDARGDIPRHAQGGLGRLPGHLAVHRGCLPLPAVPHDHRAGRRHGHLRPGRCWWPSPTGDSWAPDSRSLRRRSVGRWAVRCPDLRALFEMGAAPALREHRLWPEGVRAARPRRSAPRRSASAARGHCRCASTRSTWVTPRRASGPRPGSCGSWRHRNQRPSEVSLLSSVRVPDASGSIRLVAWVDGLGGPCVSALPDDRPMRSAARRQLGMRVTPRSDRSV